MCDFEVLRLASQLAQLQNDDQFQTKHTNKYGEGNEPFLWPQHLKRPDTIYPQVDKINDADDLELWKEVLERPTPPPGYVCYNCYQPGHFIQHCAKELPVDYKLTPYQGSKTCVGEFKCQQCKRVWLSRRSMANIAQKCRKCRQLVYPKKQYAENVASKCGVFEKDIYKKETTPIPNSSESVGMDESYSSSSGSSWHCDDNNSKEKEKNASIWSWAILEDDDKKWLA